MGLFNVFNDNDGELESRFENDTVIPVFEVPEGITVLDDTILPQCEVEEIVLPSSLEAIKNGGDYVFEDRHYLRNVDFSQVSMLEEIPECCFDNCVSLESITFPEGVVKIGECALEGCNNLQFIVLPESLEDLSVLNSKGKCDVYLYSGSLDEESFESLSYTVETLYVLPEFFEAYKEMNEELELEMNVQIMPDEYLGAEGEEEDAGDYAGDYAGDVSFMVSVDGQVAGPYTIDELQQFVATGEFSPQVFVWRDGMAQWEIAGNVPELMNLFSY